MQLPVTVRFTRIASRELDDDNLAGAFKRCRDEVARWLGCGDSPRDPVRWEYGQEKSKRGVYGVRVEFYSR